MSVESSISLNISKWQIFIDIMTMHRNFKWYKVQMLVTYLNHVSQKDVKLFATTEIGNKNNMRNVTL